MLRGVASVLEQHHEVQLLDEAVAAAVSLSRRYIQGRQLPDKAVSVLDTACARVAVSQSAIPAALEDCVRRIEALEAELEVVDRERAHRHRRRPSRRRSSRRSSGRSARREPPRSRPASPRRRSWSTPSWRCGRS